MMDLASIRHLAAEQAKKAAKAKKQPYTPYDAAEVDTWGNGAYCPFPNIGSYSPPGWTKAGEMFVDKSGWGAEDELALTLRGMKEKIKGFMAEGKEYGYAITEEGQFQIYVSYFVKAPAKKRARKAKK